MNTSVNARQGLEQGFTLLEVLIAIVIVSIGLLTVASLQVVTQKANYDAVQRTTASLLANELAERMRTNPGTEADNNVLADYLVPTTAPLGGGSITTEPTPACISGAPCSPAQLAARDLWEWERALDGQAELSATNAQTGGLVNPTACVTGPLDGSDGVYSIAIAWRGTNPLSDSTAGSTCGQGSGNYGANDEYRRVLIYDFFINNPQV